MYVCAECGRRYDRAGACTADGGAVERAADPLLGTAVGRYRLARMLGEGGMGKVYLGVQAAIGARVAIKVLSSAEPDAVDRFFAEARAVNLIRHDNIVNIVDLARLPDGRPYIVMELVDGRTLRDLIRTGTATLDLVLRAMVEVLSALAAAHAIGIVHRDLKPDNVMLGRAGRVKVLDFGVAKLLPGMHGDHVPRTATGIAVGTPYYMAPEQVQGGEVDARSDVYAAGVMLFEAVTGRRPFEADTDFEVMSAHLETEPAPASSLRTDLPREIDQVIATALAKRPVDRFQTARAMGRAVAQALTVLTPAQRAAAASAPVVRRSRHAATADTVRDAPPPAAAPAPPARPRDRRAWIVAGAVTVIAAATVAVVVATRGGDPPTAAAPPAAAPVAGIAPPDAGRAPGSTLGDGIAETLDGARTALEGAGHALDQVEHAFGGDRRADAAPAKGPGRHHVTPPPRRFMRSADYDAGRFDPVRYVPAARAVLAPYSTELQLEVLEFANVPPDGVVDLTAEATQIKRYTFVAPGADPCRFELVVGPRQILASVSVIQTECRDRPDRGPRCSLAAVWRLARAAGAPERPAYVVWFNGGWSVTIEDDDHHVLFRDVFDDDDC